MINIELFDTYTAEIFTILYENFPVSKDIKTHEIVKSVKTDPETSDRNLQICSSTMHWLRDSGMVSVYAPSKKTFSTSDDVGIDYLFTCVVLTAKGLEILKQTPKSVQRGGASLGEEISSAVKKGMREEASELVGLALGGIVRGVVG